MHLCMGCMNEFEGGDICPHCGMDNSEIGNGMSNFLAPGTELNRKYMVGMPIGQGGFGITYIGYDNVLKTKVAIKEYYPSEIAGRTMATGEVLPFEKNKDEYDLGKDRFVNEARTLAKFSDHPCIVGVKDCFDANGTAYMVMEFLEGVNLKEYLKRKGGKVSVNEAISILTPVMDALRAVHNVGIIHRDISPDNIYITTDARVRLIDFGAARQSIGGQKSLSVMLKPGYAPEEQYRTRGNQGPWTDVYALTATLYRMITGTVPPDSLERVMEDTLEIPMDLPENIQSAIMIGMAVRAPERYRSIEQLQSTLLNKEIESNADEATMRSAAYEGNDNGTAKIWVTAMISATIVIIAALIIYAISNNNAVIVNEISDGIEEEYTSEVETPSYEETEDEDVQNDFVVVDLYKPGVYYDRMQGIENSVLVTSEDEYNDVKWVIEEGFKSYSDFVASGSREKTAYETYMFPYMYAESKAYETQWNYFYKHNITSYRLDFCEVQSLRKRDDTYYAWVLESVTETKDGDIVSSNSEWVYRLKITNRGILIFDYIGRP